METLAQSSPAAQPPAHMAFPAHVIPNHDAMAIANLVPGAEMLGYGFNIFGAYSFDSATRPLFQLGTPALWNAPNGEQYNLPSNVGAGGGESSAAAYSFDSVDQFTSHFQGSAGVSGSYGAFSASFSSAYQSDEQSSSSYSWALVESKILSWSLRLTYSPGTVRPDVHSDPDFANLPSIFEPANAQLFFTFFNKFGTHFISQVGVGGMLYYYYAVSRSASLNDSQVRLSASAEYNGLIAKGRVEAEAQWSQCARNWTQSRQSHAVTVPATTGVVNWVSPPGGSWDENGTFAAWQNAVEKYPARTTFRLMPISVLFSGQQADAVQQAYQAYTQTRALVQAYRTRSCTLIIGGRPIVPPGGYPAPIPYSGGTYNLPGWHLVVLDRTNLALKLNQYYTFDPGRLGWPDDTYNRMVSDLQPYLVPGRYILIAATAFMDDGGSPNDALFRVLESFGAGAKLARWMTSPNHGCSQGLAAAYALVGVSGSPMGYEDWVEVWFGVPGDGVTINAYMQPQRDGTFLPVA